VGAFGERLKREREQRKITLEEIAAATKIGGRMLRALEEEKFDLLPGGIFNRGFVRAYARHLGLSEDQAVADYTEAYRAAHPEQQPAADPEAEGRKILEQRALHAERKRPRMEQIPWGKAAVALMLLVFGLALLGSYWHHSKSNPLAGTARRPMTKVPHQAPEPPLHAQSSGKPASAPARPSLDSGNETDSSAATLTNVSDQALSAPGSFRVLIRAREDSWLQITADGKEVLADTLAAQSQKSFGARNEIVVKAGNVGALEFWFNGRKLPAQGDLDEVKILTFDPAGLVTPTARIQPVATTLER
jgi:cytoskeletal protein RodZ